MVAKEQLGLQCCSSGARVGIHRLNIHHCLCDIESSQATLGCACVRAREVRSWR